MPTVPEPLRGVLFDMDGTLADSYHAITASVNHVCQLYDLPTWTEPAIRARVGFGMQQLMEELFPGVDVAEVIRHYRDHHNTVLRSHTQLLPGTRALLQMLQDWGIHMAVCSNKAVEFTRELVSILEIDHYFAAVLGPEDVPEAKPAPDMLFEAARRLGVDPRETLYIGDMVVDIQTGQAAGIPVWVVTTGSHDHDTLTSAQPAAVFRDMWQVMRTLEGSR